MNGHILEFSSVFNVINTNPCICVYNIFRLFTRLRKNSTKKISTFMALDDRIHYTNPISHVTRKNCEQLIKMALAEDAPQGDPTSEAIFSPDQNTTARIISRESGVLCGMAVLEHLIAIYTADYGAGVEFHPEVQDGVEFHPGQVLGKIRGALRDVLRLERIMLNFLQYLSGIASTTAKAVQAAGSDIAILDTRKTLPGYRILAKYAVYCGGGTNHRIHLSDMAMIKDNHVAAAGSIRAAILRVRAQFPDLPLNVEIDTLDQLQEALPLNPDVVLLDNMRRPQIQTAIAFIQAADRPPIVEVSGSWKPEMLKELKGLGKLGVSMGYLTHTTRFLDLSLDVS